MSKHIEAAKRLLAAARAALRPKRAKKKKNTREERLAEGRRETGRYEGSRYAGRASDGWRGARKVAAKPKARKAAKPKARKAAKPKARKPAKRKPGAVGRAALAKHDAIARSVGRGSMANAAAEIGETGARLRAILAREQAHVLVHESTQSGDAAGLRLAMRALAGDKRAIASVARLISGPGTGFEG